MASREDDQEQWEWCQECRRTHKKWIVKVKDQTKVRYFDKKRYAILYAAWMRLWYGSAEIEQEK